jgi:hypothetical protein
VEIEDAPQEIEMRPIASPALLFQTLRIAPRRADNVANRVGNVVLGARILFIGTAGGGKKIRDNISIMDRLATPTGFTDSGAMSRWPKEISFAAPQIKFTARLHFALIIMRYR